MINSFAEMNYLFFFFILTFCYFFSSSTNFRLLLNSELFWIILYTISVIASFFCDDVYLLSLSLFFLMLSAAEISIGLVFLNNQIKLGSPITIKYDI
uniref:NADH dehydrogenase subunit 4L n=1 Tax=Euplotes vanleeuwenhoeki TaxID=2794224 RepID=A0A7T1FUF3_9SPIT|nr:hypothetical protein KQ443_mgp35 [Euplotes vanleeuwenhoeki]QPM99243.1 hypothetical protein MitoLV_10 [Euplotes vanleeuwenhoeki]